MQNPTLASAEQTPIPTSAAAPRSGFDSLTDLDAAELEALFAAGSPDTLDAIAGHPRGRWLAAPRLERAGLPRAVIKALAASPLLVWQGKSFASAPGAREGIGTNRVRAFGRRAAFAFRTFITESLVDGKPAIAISYDVPSNPAYARSTYDELRRVGPQLYLGRGMKLRPGKTPALLVWFAVDASAHDAPVAWPAAERLLTPG